MKETEKIIFKKSRRRSIHDAPHGGAWKVAYADFVTAMMTLFIVLWIIAHNQNVRSSVAQYFRNPSAAFTGSSGVLDGSAGVLPAQGTDNEQGRAAAATEVEKLRVEGENLTRTVAETPGLSRFKEQVQITLTREGLRIELIEQFEGLFFDIGSARLKEDAVQLLKLVAARIGMFDNPIVVEGHTDGRPYHRNGYDNWDLSTDRANAARRELEQAGIGSKQIASVNGYADRRLKTPENPLDSTNRRVTILVTFSASAKTAQVPP